MKKTVQFIPDNVTVEVDEGENLLTAAARAGVYIHAYCGGDGVCGKCRVKVDQGKVASDPGGRLPATAYEQGYRLACQSQVVSDLCVTIPAATTKDGKGLKRKPVTTRAVSARSLETLVGSWQLKPSVEKVFLKLAPPSLDHNIPDIERLLRAIREDCRDCVAPAYDHPQLLADLPFILRQADWQVTVTLLRGKRALEPDRIIAVAPGNTTDTLYGLAVDIGTTTICALLIDLASGTIVAEASAYNEQISYGEDVISRIIYTKRAGGLKSMQEKVVQTINTVIEAVCKEAAIVPHDISYMMAAGNTIMSHLLLALDPKFLREAPYVPVCGQFPLTHAATLGLTAHPALRLFLYPAVASYVGGDIVAGVHASQMYKSSKLTLFIDIGTNGEIVVGNEEWMVCAACSAGPAFEGGGIKYGMRANRGAIEDFQIHPETYEPMIITIDRVKPCGICGSGLIAIVSELLSVNLIDQQGKFNRTIDHPRIRPGTDGYEYVLAFARDSLTDEDIVITEVDIENMIRAKGAMYAGYVTLLESVGMSFADLERVILAGNFGAYLDLERAITIGLLPDIERDKFFYLGNASLLGCRISLIDHDRFMERFQVSSVMTNMELSENPQFMDNYMASLFLPHTDMRLFPSCAPPLSRAPTLPHPPLVPNACMVEVVK